MAKDQCICCPAQRQGIPKPVAPARVRTDDVLMQPEMKVGSFNLPSPVTRRSRGIQSISPGEVARRAVKSCRSFGAQKLHRKNFESRPSRLSKVATADNV